MATAGHDRQRKAANALLAQARPTMMHTSYHSVSNTLQSPFYTLENVLRRTVLTSSRGLIVLHICGSSPVFVAHRKNESSTIHLCTVCLFLFHRRSLYFSPYISACRGGGEDSKVQHGSGNGNRNEKQTKITKRSVESEP